MTAPTAPHSRLENAAWWTFVACVALVPLSVGKLPFVETPITYTMFGLPQRVTLALGLAIALALWGLSAVSNRPLLLSRTLTFGYGGFLLWSAVSTAAASEPLRSLFGASASPFAMIDILNCTCLLFLTTQMLSTRGRLENLTWTIVISATCVAFLGLLQQLFSVDVLGLPAAEDWLVGRGFSTLGNPDQLGTFLVLPAVLAAGLTLSPRTSRYRIPAGLCFLILGTVLVGTLTRGAWVGLFAGLVTLAAVTRGLVRRNARKSSVLVVATIVAAAVAVAVLVADPADFRGRLDVTSRGVPAGASGGLLNLILSDRVNIWRASSGIVAEDPLTGTGPAAYELGWYRHAVDPNSSGGVTAIADDAHSLVFTVAATTGVPGLILLAYAMTATYVAAIRTLRSQSDAGGSSRMTTLWSVWFAGASGLLVSMVVAALSTPSLMLLFVALGAMIRPELNPVELDKPAARIVPALGLTVSVLMVLGVTPTLRAELALASLYGTPSVDIAARAAAITPWNPTIQNAYLARRTEETLRLLESGSPSARDELMALNLELIERTREHDREFVYPSGRAELLRKSASILSDDELARQAVDAADQALAIMPADIATRMDKALALNDLQRFEGMAATLRDYWENELSSPYPGIVYAQASALSGDTQEAERVFAQLKMRFPNDTSIESARQQVLQALPE